MIATTSPFSLASKHIDEFKQIVGEKYVFVDEDSLYHYSHDETEDFHFLPDVVLKPRTAEEISAVLKICNQYKIPVTPRGAGTGRAASADPRCTAPRCPRPSRSRPGRGR